MKPPTLKIGTSGIRGIVGESLTPELVSSFAAAFGSYIGPKNIVIGTDTRPSRTMVTHATTAGLLSVGCTPVHLGVVPVPTLQFYVRKLQAGGGICITASHNPMKWNALKFFGKDGIAIRPNQLSELTDLYHQGLYPRVNANNIPSVLEDSRALEVHTEAILDSVDVELIRSRRFKVAVDCCNGAGSLASPAFLKKLGCEILEINTSPGKPFPRNPEPLKPHIGELCDLISGSAVQVGFAQDADADRLALVDEKGESLGEECTVAIAVKHFLEKKLGPVVVNLSTSMMIDDIASQYQVPVYRTRVGDVYVVEKMLACSSPIGGEGNGGLIYPAVNPCRDSFIAMAMILEALAKTQVPLSQLRKQLPQYSIIKERVPCRSRDVAAFIRLLGHLYRDEELDLTDGIKVIWPDKWLHVRGSNTEPILRIIAEARTEQEAMALVSGVTEYLRPVVS
jgi:phosphomannomutase